MHAPPHYTFHCAVGITSRGNANALHGQNLTGMIDCCGGRCVVGSECVDVDR